MHLTLSFLILFLLTLTGPVSSSSPAIISWISEPVGTGETALVLGSGFDAATTRVTLSTTSEWLPRVNLTLTPLLNHTTSDTLKFTIPSNFPLDAWSVTISNVDGETSMPYLLNAARPWWVQGDIGDAATPGGWVRVFGLGVASVDPDSIELAKQLRVAARAVAAAPSGGANGLDSVFGVMSERVASLRTSLRATPPPNCTLRLTLLGGTGSGGGSYDITATPGNASTWSAYFPVPTTLPPGEYAISVSNGRGGGGVDGGFIALDSFVSPSAPHTATLTVASPRAWPGTQVFPVTTRSLPCHPPCATSDAALTAALDAAAAAGGGTVFFPRGQYFLTQPVRVPPSTVLAGALTEHVAIYFSEYASAAGAPAALFSLTVPQNGSATGSWGVRDVTVFVSGFHNVIFDANNVTDGFYLRRVRLRANAFFGANEEFTSTRGRWQNYTWASNGAALLINGRNWEVTDCDLYSTTAVISSQRPSCLHKVWPGECHAASYGYVARNRLWNGAVHTS